MSDEAMPPHGGEIIRGRLAEKVSIVVGLVVTVVSASFPA